MLGPRAAAAMPAPVPRCQSISVSRNTSRSRVGNQRNHGALFSSNAIAHKQIAFRSQPPTQLQHRSSARHCHYPHSAQPTAASFNPASMRSRSSPLSGPVLTTRPHRTLKIQNSICSDSIVSNFDSTASFWRLFQRYRPFSDLAKCLTVSAQRAPRDLGVEPDRLGGSSRGRQLPPLSVRFRSAPRTGCAFHRQDGRCVKPPAPGDP